ncbi:gp53-like domain-containing protein [Geminicoccus flavidas]|uniref:gp53-like domain-containing protein n=1 Tax=Geminicoccus flavidas TaxID=2506407 RepID=UPI0013594949|nr:hypothetical protein [Geminicoccus flavidas]
MAYLGNSPLNALFSFTPVTLAQGQTQVLVNYTPGRCLFFKNGALLDPNVDYTAANGSTVTLASPASAGDVLVGINLASFAVANALPLSGGMLTGPVTGPASATESIGGLIEIATSAEARALADDVRALTPKKLADAFTGANQSLAASGYQKLPGGLIEQWFVASNTNNLGAGYSRTSYPIPFPNACRGLSFANLTSAAGGYAVGFACPVGSPGAANFDWVAYTASGTPSPNPSQTSVLVRAVGH